ncbi:MAG TPA: ketoacyl-ACP synthase III [Candidatus Paenalcaligenes intestinipullorum]|uniref:Beta-ketoacyl-[acyl-carrier-protein] synthase III n=1 Tax=Candidatus Paenalcaligenes intestinipullorum TaxID=2838718 RepID=A0A9D2U9V5_9BURK|nr:ketoacyl-ACP synthase III [Candidatus Paenalcaligenes intestinipullorum]
MSYAKLIGSGGYLPPRVVSNDELAAELAQQGIETSDAWIRERTGIQQRHLVEPGVKTSELATKAAQAALADAGITADQLDLIILATATPDFVFPSTACIVQAALGASNAAAFDVQAVCSGFVYALTTADAYIQAGRAKTVLVIGAEVFSRILDWRDRGTCVLFGDGAGAVIMQASDKPGVIGAKLHADGNYANILCTAGNVDQGQVTGDPFLRMDGQAVFKFAVTALADSAQQVCDDAGIRLQDIDWLVPHQANVRILNFLSRKLGVDNDKVIVTVAEHANTSAASVPLALDVARRDGRIKSGDLVLLQGVGGGFTWGSVLLRI